MVIKQLLEMPIGYRTGGFVLTVKTAKKRWQVTNLAHHEKGAVWMQQAVVTDETGDMLVDVKTNSTEHGNHAPLQVGQLIRVIICEIQTAYDAKGINPEPNKKLYIDQYEDFFIRHTPDKDSPWGPEDEAFEWAEARRREIEGKIRHGLSCAIIRHYGLEGGPNQNTKSQINEWVEFIMKGE